MVWDIIRDSTFGQLVRLATGNKYFQYPEERPHFEFSRSYGDARHPVHPIDISLLGGSEITQRELAGRVFEGEDSSEARNRSSEQEQKWNSENLSSESFTVSANNSQRERDVANAEKATRSDDTSRFRRKIEAPRENNEGTADDNNIMRTRSGPIVLVRTNNGTILVNWYTPDDPLNPMNWSTKKKLFVAFQIDLYTFAVYMASSIYTSSEEGIMHHFGVRITKAELGLALYVLGYGMGPLIWSPLSEIPIIGRNGAYISTFAVYIILSVPTALVDNLGGLLFLRFLTGFFGSPCLANGGASMQDIFGPFHIAYAMGIWTAAAFLGPALGPLLAGFSVTAEGWRWSLWEILWLAGPTFVIWVFFLPETSSDCILLHRARRLRKLTSDSNLQSASEIKQRGMTAKTILVDAVIKPFEISFLDPAVLFVNVYTALIYGTYYSFFEAFALVYGPMYGFSLGMTGVAFLTVLVAVLIAASMFFSLIYFVVVPQMKTKGPGKQEDMLKPSLIMVFGPPIGLLLFGWTARASVNYMASLVGIGIYSGSVFIVMLGIFTYLPMSYPQYAASLFASNDLCRSSLAFGAVLFGRPLYLNLGIGPASSLLAGLSLLGVIGLYILYFFGEKMRSRSKFAVEPVVM